MRVPLLAALMFGLLSFAAGAGGMFLYLGPPQESRLSRRDVTSAETDVAHEPRKAQTGSNNSSHAKACSSPCSPVGKSGDLKAHGDDPGATKLANGALTEPAPTANKPAATLPPENKPASDGNSAPAKEGEKPRVKMPEGMPDMEELMGKRVDFRVTVSGTVTDSQGQPVANAEVFADVNEKVGDGLEIMLLSFSDIGTKVATSDSAGSFSGTVSSKVSEKASVTLAMRARAKGFADSKKISVEAKNGDNKSDIKLALRGAGSVRGRVIDAAGMGVAGLTVSLSGASENSGGFVIEGMDFGPGADSKNSAVTDTNGDYQIVDVAEGSYKISLRAPGFKEKSGPRSVDVSADSVSQVSSAFVVAATTSLRAKLVGEDGKPLMGWVVIELSNADGHLIQKLNASVGAEGVVVINDPPLGGFNVTVKLWGYHDSAKAWQTFSQDLPTDLGTISLLVNPEASGRSSAHTRD